jgi:hypothetical protein
MTVTQVYFNFGLGSPECRNMVYKMLSLCELLCYLNSYL